MLLRIKAYLRYGETGGGKPSALYQNPGTISLFDKTLHLRPEGGKPSALYQNPGTISLFDKTLRLRSN